MHFYGHFRDNSEGWGEVVVSISKQNLNKEEYLS